MVDCRIAGSGALAGLATLFLAGQASAQYAPPPNNTYAPAPTYAPPPPAYGPSAPPPNYAPPPPGYGATYAPPPPPSSGMRWHGSDFEIARQGVTLEGMLGFGADSYSGFGLGIQGGYTLPAHVYLGGNFTYFTGDAIASEWLLEFQAGYDLAVIKQAPVLIRPYLGLGYEHYGFDIAPQCVGLAAIACAETGTSTGGFVISLGASGTYFFTPHWFAGVDLRFDIATVSAGWTVFDAFAVGGYKF